MNQHAGPEQTFEQLCQMMDALPCMGLIEQAGQVIFQNLAAASQSGFKPDSRVPLELMFIGAYPSQQAVTASPVSFDSILIRQNGDPLAVQGAIRVVAPDTRLIVLLERRAEASRAESFLGDLLDSAPEAMAITHDGRVLHVNREFTRLFGHAAESCIGEKLDSLLLPEGRIHENDVLYHMLASEGRGSMETQRLASDGSAVDVSLLVAPVNLGGSSIGLFYTFRDIRRQKEQEARLHHNAMHDALTGLANRALFFDRLRLTLTRLLRRPDRHFAVMFLDLDQFKQVNDTLGHGAGDALLLEVTRRLKECVRPQDTVARFGGDEFAVLIDEAGTAEDVGAIAARIQATIRKPVVYEGETLTISASIGIAVVTQEYRDAESVIRDADFAMYQAKAAGKAQYAFSPAPTSGNATMQPWPSAHASRKPA